MLVSNCGRVDRDGSLSRDASVSGLSNTGCAVTEQVSRTEEETGSRRLLLMQVNAVIIPGVTLLIAPSSLHPLGIPTTQRAVNGLLIRVQN